MKVCLIDAAAVNTKRFLPHWTPLGLAYIAATLERGGHEVLIIERDVLFRKNRLSIDKVDHIMEERLTLFGPDLIGLSSALRVVSGCSEISPHCQDAFSSRCSSCSILLEKGSVRPTANFSPMLKRAREWVLRLGR